MSPFSYFVKSFPVLTTLAEMLTFLLFFDDFDSQLLLLFLGGGVCLFLKIQYYINFKVDNTHFLPILERIHCLFMIRVEVFTLVSRPSRTGPRWIGGR